MAKVELVDVSHAYVPGDWALRDINITWQDGVASALLGPSGCGKTTLLKIISGLLKPTEGKVLLDGEDVTGLSPQERHVAQVFQFPVVYETLNVYDNLAFPLRNQGADAATVDERVRRVAEMLELSDLLRANASRLGAAEKQRISMGRGIVREDTTAVLFDEPLTVIDPQMKWHLRRQLKELHQEVGMTMVYVTHDQHEALTFADMVTVMDAGRALQTASPETLHRRPQAPFVGYFIGSPGMNLFDLERDGDRFRLGDLVVDPGDGIPEAESYRLGIRPEYILYVGGADSDERGPSGATGNASGDERGDERGDDGAFEVEVRDYTLTGSAVLADVEGAGIRFKVRLPEDRPVRVGETLSVRFPPDETILYVDDDAVDAAPEVRA